MEFRNPKLYAGGKAYVEAGLRLLAGRCGAQDRMAHETTEWVPSGGKVEAFVKRTHQVRSWSGCVQRHKDALHALSEWTNLVSILRADEVIAPQLDTLVGSPFGRSRLETQTVADGLLTRTADTISGFKFREKEFSEIYHDVERAFYEPHLVYIAVAPISGLTCKVLPIDFDKSIAIDRMTDEEVAKCAATGLLRSPFADIGMVFVGSSRCCVRVTLNVPKVVGDTPADPIAPPDLWAPISGVLLALRLSRGARVNSLGNLSYSDSWFTRGNISWRNTPVQMLNEPKYTLTSKEVEPLCKLWRVLGSEGVRKRKALGAALRRFEYAGERYRPEDRLVDLMVAAESLFLYDAGDPQSRGELGYRLALRSAFFIQLRGRTRRQVFDLMRRAYDTRSKVVHGNVPDSVALPHEVLSLEEFTSRVEDHIRAALTKAVEIAERKPAAETLVAWEDLILC
jgi:hypothetical protein